jgi:hypothetical protein
MEIAMLDHTTAERLAKILGMCGSDHPGERAAAALAAHRLLREHGLMWSDVIVAQQYAAPSIVPRQPGETDWRRAARFCLGQTSRLQPREFDFIVSIARREREPTPRQLAWLRYIAARLRAASC